MQKAPVKNRFGDLPFERWPESLRILRALSGCTKPQSIRDIAKALECPEISTRTRLAKLEATNTVQSVRQWAQVSQGKSQLCIHYLITQYGRDLVGGCITEIRFRQVTTPVNSVFELGRSATVKP